jgi:hypothetical protein
MKGPRQTVPFPESPLGGKRELFRLLRAALWLAVAHVLWLAYALGDGRPQPWLSCGGDISGPLIAAETLLWPVSLVVLGCWVASIGRCTHEGRAWSPWMRAVGLAYVSLPLASLLLHPICPLLRRAAVPRLVRQAAPLVAALRHYEADRGEPPLCLADLVPEYLSRVPATGMRAMPEFAYERYEPQTGGSAKADTGPTWRLAIHLPSGPIWHEALQIGTSRRFKPPDRLLARDQPGLGQWQLYHLWIQYGYAWP